MTDVSVVAKPDMDGKRLGFVLAEDRLGHYQEFRDYFIRLFDLDRVGLAEPGYLRAPSGMIFALIFIGRSGEAFPSGVEIHAVTDALEPLDDARVDRDVWAILNAMIEAAGAPWTARALREVGRLYRIPAETAQP